MDRYEQDHVVGEGSYGLVMKCRHKETDQIVAVKKFLETEEDASIRRMALREIRMLKRLKHENLVTMIEVFRHRKRFYIVFEYVAGTVLDELEKCPKGLGLEISRDRIFQVIRAVGYCHNNYIIHRDVKPENVLVSTLGVVKLCDFGFARIISPIGEPYTEYVATRWYRAPELLVGDVNYSGAVDIWAIGCLFVEMMTADPIFPGDSDIDQLYLIVKMLGAPCVKHQNLMSRNSQLRTMIKSANRNPDLYTRYPDWPAYALRFLSHCLRMDPDERLGCDELLNSEYFTHDRFAQRMLPALRDKVNTEFNNNPLLRKFKTEILMSTDKRDELLKHQMQMQQHQSQPQPQQQRKYTLPGDSSRWKINVPGMAAGAGAGAAVQAESGTKRKFQQNDQTQHTINQNCSDNSGSGVISLTNSSLRLSLFQNNNNANIAAATTSTRLSYQKQASFNVAANNKVVDPGYLNVVASDKSTSKLVQKASSPRSLAELKNKMTSPARTSSPTAAPVTPSKSLKEEHEHQPATRISNAADQLYLKTPLRPSINNLNLNVPRKSPTVQKNAPVPSKPHQQPVVPLGPPRNVMKKLDRNVNVDTTNFSNMTIETIPASMGPNSWIANYMPLAPPLATKKRDSKKIDNFTLPNVPGATGNTPSEQVKKKSLQSNDPSLNSSNQVTPDYRYRKTKRKLKTVDISVPVTVRERQH